MLAGWTDTSQDLLKRSTRSCRTASSVHAGYSRDAIWEWRRAGVLENMTEGVYRIPGSPRTWEQRLCAMVLASGPVAAASHRSAAALLGIPGFERRGLVEVVTPRPRHHRERPALVHRWRVLPEDAHHRHRRDRLHAGASHAGRPRRRASSVPHRASGRQLSRHANRHGRSPCERSSTSSPSGDGRGSGRCGGILDERAEQLRAGGKRARGPVPRLLRAAGLPEPVRQLDIGDSPAWIGRVDFAYPSARLVDRARQRSPPLLEARSGGRQPARRPADPSRVADRRGSAGTTSSVGPTRSSPGSVACSQTPRPDLARTGSTQRGLTPLCGTSSAFRGPRSTPRPGRPRPPGRRARRRCG